MSATERSVPPSCRPEWLLSLLSTGAPCTVWHKKEDDYPSHDSRSAVSAVTTLNDQSDIWLTLPGESDTSADCWRCRIDLNPRDGVGAWMLCSHLMILNEQYEIILYVHIFQVHHDLGDMLREEWYSLYVQVCLFDWDTIFDHVHVGC